MKKRTVSILTPIALLCFAACEQQTIPEPLAIQKPYTYSDRYYQNLRDYKKSPHQIAYAWFADYTQSYSYGQRFTGLPDSLDICSLWGGIPNKEVNAIAYEEMRYIREVKGTRMVVPTIVRIEDAVSYGNEEFYQLFQDSYREENQETAIEMRNRAIRLYADRLLNEMWEHDLDGLDLDYEPEGDRLSGANFTTFVEYIGGIIGPKSANPDKLLIVDFYNQVPPADTEPYVDYFVRQSYNARNATTLQNQYNQLSWCPPGKFIVSENIGDFWQNGGNPFTEADGNTLNDEGQTLHSLEGMARWNPTQGAKGGFGAFYVQRDYNSSPPYKHFRKGIQVQNPAVK